jgi:hypothetical protein
MDTSGFYSSQSSFRDFEGFTDSNNYQKAPGDWSVYVTDVVNSTRAIEAGKYKEVNLIGAASITLCINLLKCREFPFVFGGDGASFCIHANDCPADAELGSLLRLALDNYGLELRVARIPDSGHYMQHMRYHSDYRKFDDTLRLVLDCSEEQAAGLEAVLEAARSAGLIHYGLHRSDAALMTCFVQTMQDGGHLHFIDGGNGGFATAAQQLKQQLRQVEPRPADE